jgi:glycerophosphoryl diester phosphodiesterase
MALSALFPARRVRSFTSSERQVNAVSVGLARKSATALVVVAAWITGASIGYGAGVPLHDGLLTYWSLNENFGSIAHDTGPAGSVVDNGQVRNSAAWINGIFGAGLQFNGTNQDVLIPSSADMNIGSSAVTLSAWVKLDVLPSNQTGSFVGILDSTADNYVFYLDKGSNELRFKVTTASGVAERPGVPGEMLNTTNWLHIMGVYDGARAKMYFNGNLVDSHTAAGLSGLVRSGQVSGIGSQPADSGANAPSNLFKGGIADVAVWNRPLGFAEAQYLYNSGIGNAVGAANPSIEPIVPTPPPNNDRVIVAAHRGYSVVAPENTLSAFTAAKGFADRIEFDVQPAKDGTLVVMHDGTVDRTTDGTGAVSSLNYAGQIDGLDAGSWFSPAFAGEPVPTMKQSVERIFADGMVPLIERKAGTASAYVNELTQMGILDDVVIIAFDWNFLAQVRALAPNVQLGALGSGTLNASVIEDIASRGIDFVNWGDGAAVNTANVDLAHAAGLEFHVWTINSTGRMQQLIDLGVDGITTDDPAALRELVPFSPADFNSNGVVDADDLALWKTGFGTSTGTTRADGDADNDGDVDGGDYLVWQQQFTAGTASTSAAATVPEPSAALLAGLALAAATTIRGHRRAAAKSKRAISGV